MRISIHDSSGGGKPEHHISLREIAGRWCKRQFRLSLILSGTILLLITACRSDSKSPLEPRLFAKIYTEVVVQSADSTSVDSLGSLQIVLERHKVSREEFEASQTFFQDHPELWLDVFKDVEENLKQLKTEREKEIPLNP